MGRCETGRDRGLSGTRRDIARSPPVRVVCPWCREEGRPALLHEREPLDDPAETSGICPRHKEDILSALPSRSFPDARLLLVVEAGEPDLYAHLVKRLGALKEVAVIVERRRGDRRGRVAEISDDRRRAQRRLRRGEIYALGYTLIRFRRPSRPSPVA